MPEESSTWRQSGRSVAAARWVGAPAAQWGGGGEAGASANQRVRAMGEQLSATRAHMSVRAWRLLNLPVKHLHTACSSRSNCKAQL